ncbi:CU044_2847 family protein [Tolypothrix sp. PCC 7910]|uniref:CU044_2847 family protein n=1 Tax=Tolypothrix sp. PCC 7910 TaxID=2099387 RepID=UPI001FCA7AAF|nr:CU044_2847 family protein [Tolypothrix sp. PCC 7910]
MEAQTKVISVELSDGSNVRVEATLISERKLSIPTRPFKEVTIAIESLSRDIAEVIQKVKPDKASVKFGIEIALESGKLTPILVKGSSAANLEITLEWSQTPVGELKIPTNSIVKQEAPINIG